MHKSDIVDKIPKEMTRGIENITLEIEEKYFLNNFSRFSITKTKPKLKKPKRTNNTMN